MSWMTPWLGSLVLGPVQFDRPEWLFLLAVVLPLVVLIGRSSLAGLEGATRWIVLFVRIVVVLALVAVLGEPSFRREAEDVAVIAILDASRSVPVQLQQEVDTFLEMAMGDRRPGDRLGVITVAKDAFVQNLPSQGVRDVERTYTGNVEASNLAEGGTLAMAISPKDAAIRLVLFSDGNETAGSLLQFASQAKAADKQIDVLPLRYRYDKEVKLDRMMVPATARQGQVINVKVAITATSPARGMIFLTMNGQPIDISPDHPSLGAQVELEAGQNVFNRQIFAGNAGPKQFEASFQPEIRGGQLIGDTLIENNRALGVTFVSGEGKTLIVREDPSESELLVRELRATGLGLEEITAEQLAGDLTSLAGYDSIILCNEPSYNFSNTQIENLKRYVHDLGGGLGMTGGPYSFGAGGWIDSGLAEALPLRLDPPNKRQMPRGALVLIMHSIEMPNGVGYGREVAKAAVNALSRLDLAGIIEYNPMASRSEAWVHPLEVLGDKKAIERSINRLAFGDMPSFDPSLRKALKGLKAANAGQRHVIILSDGDPSLNKAIIKEFVAARITISTVAVSTHGGFGAGSMRYMADETGGTYYNVGTNYADVVKIIFKEAQLIRRSLIWEGNPIQPTVIPTGSAPMRDIGVVPPITGYVVAADREGLSVVTLRAGDENDPIAAHWQYGLGRVFCVTTDATSRWAGAWTDWPGYRKFWEQHARWAMRPTGSANIRILTENEGDRTLVTIEALDTEGERLATGAFEGRIAEPGGGSKPLELRQVGPGRWEGWFRSDEPGTYVLGVRFAAPSGDGGEIIRGVAQAAVTRPFADEFRALEDNSALLIQVADMTGGRVLDPSSPQTAELFRRDGLTMPVATRAIWLPLLLAAIVLFLGDVAVRRVRIEPAAIAAAVRRGLQRRDETQKTQVEALRTARIKAKQRYGEDDKRVAKRRFEVDEEQLAKRPVATVALSGEAEKLDPASKSKPKPAKTAPADAMSRLMAAKKRAREELEQSQKDQ